MFSAVQQDCPPCCAMSDARLDQLAAPLPCTAAATANAGHAGQLQPFSDLQHCRTKGRVLSRQTNCGPYRGLAAHTQQFGISLPTGSSTRKEVCSGTSFSMFNALNTIKAATDCFLPCSFRMTPETRRQLEFQGLPVEYFPFENASTCQMAPLRGLPALMAAWGRVRGWGSPHI